MSLKLYYWDYGLYGNEVIIEESLEMAQMLAVHPKYDGREPEIMELAAGVSQVNVGAL